MRRTLVLLLVLGGIVAAVLLLLADRSAPRGHEGNGGGPGAEQPKPAPAEPLAGSDAGGSAPDRQPAIQRSGTDPVAPPPLAADSDLIEVEVRRRDDHSPVAGAEVVVVDINEADSMKLMEEFFIGATVDGILDQFGTAHQTGSDGRVRLPSPGQDALLAGRKEALFGLHPWDPESSCSGPDRRVIIEVDDAPSLRVRVTDENGRHVAGVPVSLRVGAGDFFSFDLLRARTGTDGIGEIPRAAAFTTVFSPADGGTYSAAIAAVLPTPVTTEVDIENLPAEPVELKLPPTGSVVVTIQAPDGSRCAEPLLVALAKARENPEDDDDWLAPGMPGFDAAAQRSVEGQVRFDHVGLGLPIQASAVFPGAPQASIVRAQGPQRAGETVQLTLVEQRDYPILLARLVDAAGQPLAAQTVQLQLLMAGDELDWSNQHARQTGPDGTIRLGLTPVSEEEVSVAIEWVRPASENQPELYARVDLARPLVLGENDLGTLTLGPAPILARGRVLDPDGKPVADATVMPQHRRMNELEPGSFDLEPEYGRHRNTDAQGSFTLTGAWNEPELLLSVTAGGFLPAEAVIAPGALDVEIRLKRSFALAARLLADPGVDLSELRIELDYHGVAETHDWASVEGKDGRLQFGNAPPGLADLVIRTPNSAGPDEEVLRITGIEVGASAPDPRLDPIDLRGKLFGCKILARAADGSELEDLQAWTVANPGNTAYGWNGTVSLISREPLGEVVVSAPGWREVRLTPVNPTEEVILAAGLQIRLSTQAAGGQYRMGVLLISGADPGSWWRGTRQMFDAGGNATLTVSAPGSYEVAFLVAPLLKDGEDDQSWNHVWVPQPDGEARQRIEVLESGTVQSFRVKSPPAERIAEAVNQIEEEGFNPF